ncbi:MAG: HD-GYP domain-containing protein [Cognaticolwellia aestuarii]
MIVEKKMAELSPGHYVVDIVSQQGSYQLKSSGHIKNVNVINHLTKRGVASVLIDADKTLNVSHFLDNGDAVFEHIEQPDTNHATVILDIAKAKKVFTAAKNAQKMILMDAFHGKELNIEPVQDVTDAAIDTIYKNPDALACVLNIRKKDEYLLEHSASVSILLSIFAKFLDIEKSIIQQLAIGAFLHDVGKIKIPDEILNKPSKLTDDEFVIMKTHANHSINIITNTAGISDISIEVAALHHEKLNGSGYPYQLKNDEISLYGRMITICDIFDALTADRIYKKGYPHVKAFSILRQLAQKGELDVILVDQFIRCMGVYPVGSLVELNSHKLAIVEQRSDDPVRPKVRSFYNLDYRHYIMAEDIDLSKKTDSIAKSVRADEFDLDMNKIVEFLMMQG